MVGDRVLNYWLQFRNGQSVYRLLAIYECLKILHLCYSIQNYA